MLLEHIEYTTAPNPDACIIWLHGLGADGNDFAGIVPELHLPPELKIRFIFPHAPYRAITLNSGNVMRGWYDLASLNIGSAEDSLGITEAAEQINAFIDHQIESGIRRQRIILIGFSQGGAVTLYTGLRQTKNLGGIAALSTYVPLVGNPVSEIISDRSLPIFMAHGVQDEVVNYRYGVQSRAWLQQQGYKVDWHEYPMAHSVNMNEISDLRNWLVARLQAAN
jgi:phospholipase/carboxylesterase